MRRTALERSVWQADFDRLSEALAPWMVTLADGSEVIDPEAPDSLTRPYRQLLQEGWANGFFTSSRRIGAQESLPFGPVRPPVPETLVAIDWDDAGLSIQPVLDFVTRDGGPNALLGHTVERKATTRYPRGQEETVERPYHYVVFDRNLVRGADVHSKGYHSGFLVNLESGDARTASRRRASTGDTRPGWCPWCGRDVTWTDDPLIYPAPSLPYVGDHWVCPNYHEATAREIEVWSQSREFYGRRAGVNTAGRRVQAQDDRFVEEMAQRLTDYAYDNDTTPAQAWDDFVTDSASGSARQHYQMDRPGDAYDPSDDLEEAKAEILQRAGSRRGRDMMQGTGRSLRGRR